MKEISKGSAVSISTLHEWLAGRSPRNPLQIKAVANFLGVTLDELLFDESPKLKTQSSNTNQIETLEGLFEISLRRVQEKKP